MQRSCHAFVSPSFRSCPSTVNLSNLSHKFIFGIRRRLCIATFHRDRHSFAFDKPLHTSPLRRILDPRIVTIYANQKCSRLSRSWKTTPNPPKRNQKLYIHPRNAMPAARKRGNVGACPRQIFVTRRSARGPYWCFSLSSTFSTSSPMKTKWCFTTPKPFCHCGHVLRD